MECRCACPASKAPKQKTGPEPGISLWKPRRWSSRTQRQRIAAAFNVEGSIDLGTASAAPSELKQTSSEQCSTSAVPVPLDINIVRTIPTAVSHVKLSYLILLGTSLVFHLRQSTPESEGTIGLCAVQLDFYEAKLALQHAISEAAGSCSAYRSGLLRFEACCPLPACLPPTFLLAPSVQAWLKSSFIVPTSRHCM